MLTAAHLVHRDGAGRYAMHDLLRAFATETALRDPPDHRRAALTRLFDHYLATSVGALDLLYPHRRTAHPTTPAALTDAAAAPRWLEAEQSNLATAIGHAATHGWPRHAIELAANLARDLLAGTGSG